MIITSSINKSNIINLFSLATIQVSNILFSLLAFPYALNIVGTNKFSIIVLTEAATLILLTFVLYGFDVIAMEKATRLITNSEKHKIAKLHYDVVQLRLLLLLMSAVSIFPIANYYNDNIYLIYLSWLMFISGHIFHSSWFFQVTNNNFFPSLITLFSRTLFLLLVYFLINKEEDFKLFVFFMGSSYFVSGLGCIVYSFSSLKTKPHLISKETCIELLISAKEIVAGNLFVTFFRGSNVLILGFFANDMAISVYSLIEKIIKGMQSLVRPINQLMYPKLLRATSTITNKQSYLIMILRYSAPQLIFSVISIIFTFLLFDRIVEKIYNNHTHELFFLFTIMSPAIILGIMNYMFGTAGLNYIGKKVELARIIMTTGLITLIVSVSMIFLYKQNGAAISYLIGEFFLFFKIMLEYKKYSSSLVGKK